MTTLRKRMMEDMAIRNLSPSTRKSYINHVAAFAKYFRRSPDKLGPHHIRRYQVHLAEERGISASTLNIAVCALNFFFRVTLHRNWTVERIFFSKRERKLPVVLSQEELVMFLGAVRSIKHRAVLMTAYAAGLRIAEVTQLKVQDIDSQRMAIRVEQGKGRKDRFVMLSPRLLKILRNYWKAVRPSYWLLPGKSPKKPIAASTVRQVCKEASLASGLKKRVTPHAAQLCYPYAGSRYRPSYHSAASRP